MDFQAERLNRRVAIAPASRLCWRLARTLATAVLGLTGFIPTVHSLVPLTGVTAIATGSRHTCALTSGGEVKCWGYNGNGQLGDGTVAEHWTPMPVSGLTSGVMAIAAGSSHTCALTSNGGVKCWGTNFDGQLGDGTAGGQHTTPIPVSGLTSGVTAIAAGSSHTCALISNGGVKCWGRNAHGQLGDGTNVWRLTPTLVSVLTSGVTSIATGLEHTCALTSGGGVKCWGSNSDGELGDGTFVDHWAPMPVSGLTTGVTAIATGSYHTCALTSGGGVKCWGGNSNGQLGVGTFGFLGTPIPASSLTSGVTAIAAGRYHTCALTSSGGVKCFGSNSDGQLGDGTFVDHWTPMPVSGLTSGVTAIALGGLHTCALTSGGGVKCWGFNWHGQLGDGTSMPRYIALPVDVLVESNALPPISCSGFTTTRAIDLAWSAGGARVFSSDVGGFYRGDALVIRFSVPAGATSGIDSFRLGDWVDLPTNRTATLATTPCQFSGGIASKTGQQIRLDFSIGANSAGYPTLQAGTTYYLNVVNRIGGVDQCGSRCNVFVETGVRTYTIQGRTSAVGTTVKLENVNNPLIQISPVVSDQNGGFKITGVAPGEWKISASKSGFRDYCGLGADDSLCRLHVDRDITHNIVMDPLSTTRRPVLLVPGVMGSTLSEFGLQETDTQAARGATAFLSVLAPKLPMDRCELPPANCPLRHYLGIFDPIYADLRALNLNQITVMDSAKLIKELEIAGYQVFPSPWDWREPLDRAYQIYLKRWIDDAKRKTGFQKVDIVAHSMGGLVARKYIQSDDYQDDVGKLIMVGTPNGGSTNAYYLMHGGDPISLDSETVSGFLNNLASPAFYTAAVNELWRSYHNGEDIVSVTGAGNVDLFSGYKGSNDTARKSIKDFLNKNVPGGNDLLPTYDFLRKWSSTWGNFNGTDFALGTLQDNGGLNPGLDSLNAGPRLDRFVTINASPGLNQVGTRLLLSISEDTTLRELGYRKLGTDTYPRGIPDFTGPRKQGDGTVVSDTATGVSDAAKAVFSGKVVEDRFGTHPAMVGKSRCKVVEALTGSDPCTTATSARMAAQAAPQAQPMPMVSFSVHGNYQLLLYAPDGAATGTGYALGDIREEIPDSSVYVSPYLNIVKQGSPPDGAYGLVVSADPIFANTAPRIYLNGFDPVHGAAEETVRLLIKPAPYELELIVDSAANQLLQIIDTVGPPTGLRAQPSFGKTNLVWLAANDATVAGYRIYLRGTNLKTFSLLGETTNTTYPSDVAWASSDDTSSEFLVVSVNGEGVESLIRPGNAVRNATYAHVTFTAVGATERGIIEATAAPLTVSFLDQSDATSQIAQWAWDFNGDGIVDSTAQNPNYTFPALGTYAVSLKVTAADGSKDELLRVGFVRILEPTAVALTVTKSGNGIVTSSPTGINCGSDCTESYVSGNSVTLTATPSPNAPGGIYMFDGWGGDCSGFGTQSTCTLSMNATRNVSATFSYIGFGSDYSRNYVQKAYVAYYGRPADPGGQSYWAGRMDAEGQSLNAIIGEFGNSAEFNLRYGGRSHADLVTKIYQQALGRDPDQGGLDWYVAELVAGRRTLQTITLDVLNGATTAPDSTVVANKLDVAAYYTAKVASGCLYGTEQDGVNVISGVTAISSTVAAAKGGIDTRCGP